MLLAEPGQLKGLEFERLYMLGLEGGRLRGRHRARAAGSTTRCSPSRCRPPARSPPTHFAPAAPTSRRAGPRRLVLSFPERPGPAPAGLADLRGGRRARRAEETHDEELFGPAEGLHSTYRMIRDEVLEASWRAGAALSEMRLDTAEDVNRAVARSSSCSSSRL